MSDEGHESPDWQFRLSRRGFLQLGAASPFLVQDYLNRQSEALHAAFDPGRSPADGAKTRSLRSNAAASRPTPTQRRDYFPIESELVSVRGLAPPRGAQTPLGRDVWLGDQTFSLRNLALHRHEALNAFGQHFPHSVRELITPQREGREWRRLEGRGSISTVTWANWLDDHEVELHQEDASSGERPPSEELTTEDLQERRDLLLRKVVDAARNDLQFRAVGSGHSHSEAAKPRGFYSNMKAVSGKLDDPWLRENDDPLWARNADDENRSVVRGHLIRLGAGTILKKLNRDILPGEELALPNMGAWDGQTLAGAINTSTHGTGLGMGTFADLVRSVEIITVPESRYEAGMPYVRMLRIEPSNGITDPEKFAKDASTHGMGLVQNDDLFHSVVVGYGCMGIVYAYTLELQKPYWLREENEIQQWGQFDPVQGAENNRHYSIYVDLIGPQLDADASNPACLVRTRNEAAARGREKTERSNPFNIDEEVTGAIFPNIVRPDQDVDYEELAEQMNQLNDLQAGFARGSLTQMFGYDPPFRRQRRETASYIALRRRQARYPDDPNRPPEPPDDVITMEVGVPVPAVEAAIETIIQFVKDNPRILPAPLGVRFTAGSEHFLSPEYGRPTAMLELPIPNPDALREQFDDVQTVHDTPQGQPGDVYTFFTPKKLFFQKLKKVNQDSRADPHDRETGFLDHFLNLSEAKAELEKLEDILVQEYNGRPHMGKHNTVNTSASRSYMQPRDMYSEYEKWLDAYTYLNRFGTFDGEFSSNKTP